MRWRALGTPGQGTLWPTYVALVLVVSLWAERSELASDPAKAWASVPVGVCFAATGALIQGQRGQRGNAVLFAVLAGAWVCGRLANVGAGWATAPLALFAAQVEVLAVAALLRYPSSSLERVDRRFVVASALGALVTEGGVILTSTRADLGLPAAPWPSVLAGTGASDVAQGVRGAWLGASAVVFLVLLARRWRRLLPLERRTLRPILVTAGVVALATVPLLGQANVSHAQLEAIFVVRSYSAVAVGLAFAVSAIQLKLARATLVDLVAQLGEDSSVAAVQQALRDTLSDPRLEVWYHLDDEPAGGYVDGLGARRRLSEVRGRIVLETTTAQGEPLAAVLADEGLERHRELLDAAVTVSRFALENARLEVSLRAQLRELREARGRLLSAGLEERRRLERDLHDGAQQRMLALSLQLSRIQARAEPDTARELAELRGDLQLALDELRNLARGIYPAVLGQAGLAAALEGVTERMVVPVRSSVPARRWHPDVESAAYLVVCEALTNVAHHAGPCTVELTVEERDGELHVVVADDGRGSPRLEQVPPATLQDRVSAIGGRLRVRSGHGRGTTLEAWIPCA